MSLDTLARVLPLFPWLVGLVLVVVLVVFVRRYRASRDRHLKLFAFATAQGWTYEAVDREALPHRWTGPPFGRGDEQRAGPVVTGSWRGHSFVAFDYDYQVVTPDGGGGRTRTTWRYRVTVVHMPGALPWVEVRPEQPLGRVRSSLTGEDIDLESDAFNARFRVRGLDRKTATDVLNPRTMAALLAAGHDSTLRTEGGDVVLHAAGRHTSATLRADLTAAAAFVEGVPTFVWRDRGYDPGGRTGTPRGRT